MRARMTQAAMIGEDGKKYVRLDTKLNNTNASNHAHTISSLYYILNAYYRDARKRFVDNVCMQASDYFLVNGPDAPVKVFSPTFVNELSEAQLEAIAGERGYIKRRKGELRRDVENLEKGRRFWRREGESWSRAAVNTVVERMGESR